MKELDIKLIEIDFVKYQIYFYKLKIYYSKWTTACHTYSIKNKYMSNEEVEAVDLLLLS